MSLLPVVNLLPTSEDALAATSGLAGLDRAAAGLWAADGHHAHRTPGAYEWWHFESLDYAGNGVAMTLFDGLPFHPVYHSAMARWHRRGRRIFATPPSDALPSYYPAAYLGVYQGARRVAQFLNIYPAGSFEGRADRPEIRVGPNRMTLRADGSFGLVARGYPFGLTHGFPRVRKDQMLSAELNFAPTFTGVQHVRSLRPAGFDGSAHQWVLAAPHGRMTGRVEHVNRRDSTSLLDMKIDALGYHDHMHGQGPLGSGVKRFGWGHLLLENAAVVWQRTVMTGHQPARTDGIILFETDRHPVVIESPEIRVENMRSTKWVVRYAASATMHGSDAKGNSAELILDHAHVVESMPFAARITAHATLTLAGKRTYAGEGSTQVMQLRRLRWPVLSDAVLNSITTVPADDPMWRGS